MAGIVGVYSPNNPVQQAYKALLEIQHRGQQNWGLAAGNNHSLCVYKGEGPITDVLFEDVKNAFDHLTVHAVIGHVGDKKVKTCDIAPINLKFTDGCEIAVAMSGSIFNRDSLSMK
ncbi:MAG: hypothetical protein QW761_02660, partial [Candidatus Aenigmatarchaeota archaeon]